MTVTEESRHRLHQKLDQTIGEEDATTLMEHLPPTGWIDIATKQDIEHLDHRLTMLDGKIDARYDQLDAKFGIVDEGFEKLEVLIKAVGQQVMDLGKRIDRSDAHRGQMEHQFWQFLGVIIAVTAIVLTGIKLFGG